MTDHTITEIPLHQLRESPFNPRKTFLNIEALAADIRSDGRILQPLLVRPAPDLGGECFEIVFGHRRRRGAELAGLASAPCMVREMSDAEAAMAQLRENIGREDVHPIEEAEGFAALMHEHGVTAEALAASIGKSPSYVLGRVKLLQAVPEVRQACLEGRIVAEVALYLARLRTPKLQLIALEKIKKQAYRYDLEDGGKDSVRRIREYLVETFTLDLKGAIFDPAAADLLPAAGACTGCPKRSGNALEFADLLQPEQPVHYNRRKASAEICTDPDCFEAKKKAHLARKAAELEAKGKTVVTGNKARAAIGADGKVHGAYVPLSEVREAIKKAKGDKPASVIIVNPRNGKTVEAVAREDLKAAGVKVKAEPKSDHDNYAEQQRKWEAERAEREKQLRVEQGLRKAVFNETFEAMATQPRGVFDLRMLARAAFLGLDSASEQLIAERHGIALKQFDHVGNAKRAASVIEGLGVDALTLFCLECVVAPDVFEPPESKLGGELFATAKHYGVDPEAIRKRGEEADAREVKPAAKVVAKKKAPAKKKGDPAQADLVEEAGA